MSVPFPPPLSEADYEAIVAAVMETSRGRWFLAEYARRNRHADTEMLLGAIEQLGNAVGAPVTPEPGRVRQQLVSLTLAIDEAKTTIGALGPDVEPGLPAGGKVFEAVAEAAQQVTLDLMAAAEGVQQLAWSLREGGADGAACDALDAHVRDIHTACAIQDVTGARTRKLTQLIRQIESGIAVAIAVIGSEVRAPMASPSLQPEAAPEPIPPGGLPDTDADIGRPPFKRELRAVPDIVPEDVARDPLAGLGTLSPEEKIALFT